MPVPVKLRAPLTCVWRRPDTLQVGVEDATPISVAAPPRADAVIADLNRATTLDELAARHRSIDRGWIEHVWAVLERDGRLVRPRPAPAIAVEGRGPSARVLATLLRREGVRVTTDDDPFPAASDLVIVVSASMEQERSLLNRLVGAGTPHLLVRTTSEASTVGPLVLPGRSPCVRCTDLVRRDADPRWPVMLAQLSRTPTTSSPAHVHWAAATAVSAALGWLRHDVTDMAGTTWHLTGILQLEVRHWPHHPDCPCSASEESLPSDTMASTASP